MTVPGVPDDVFQQPDCRVRLRYGRSGANDAARAGDALVVVDVLSFSTGTILAAANGARVRPCGWGEDPQALADDPTVQVAVRRHDVPQLGRYSLSPLHMSAAVAGDAIVVRSPNGATCTRVAEDVPALWVAGLVNATATAHAVLQWMAANDDGCVTVLACGERWSTTQPSREDGPLRIALEDQLGAAAVLYGLRDAPGGLSAEARAAAVMFDGCRDDVATLLADCGSGRELIAAGFAQDVELASQLDTTDAVVRLRAGWFQT